jgi:hypothetical protein
MTRYVANELPLLVNKATYPKFDIASLRTTFRVRFPTIEQHTPSLVPMPNVIGHFGRPPGIFTFNDSRSHRWVSSVLAVRCPSGNNLLNEKVISDFAG